jgi:hypothetical protein
LGSFRLQSQDSSSSMLTRVLKFHNCLHNS